MLIVKKNEGLSKANVCKGKIKNKAGILIKNSQLVKQALQAHIHSNLEQLLQIAPASIYDSTTRDGRENLANKLVELRSSYLHSHIDQQKTRGLIRLDELAIASI